MSDETEFVLIGWIDPKRRQNRLHLSGCQCSQPLRSEVHREENHVYVKASFQGEVWGE